MVRTVIYLLGAIIAITLLRSTIGLILKMAGQIINPPSAVKEPNTVEMVKCPTCGSLFAPGSAAARHSHKN
jgi:hypothetical protein